MNPAIKSDVPENARRSVSFNTSAGVQVLATEDADGNPGRNEKVDDRIDGSGEKSKAGGTT